VASDLPHTVLRAGQHCAEHLGDFLVLHAGAVISDREPKERHVFGADFLAFGSALCCLAIFFVFVLVQLRFRLGGGSVQGRVFLRAGQHVTMPDYSEQSTGWGHEEVRIYLDKVGVHVVQFAKGILGDFL
jgi:hypothetical protein